MVTTEMNRLSYEEPVATVLPWRPMVQPLRQQQVASPAASFLDDDFFALSRVVSALNANRITFGYRGRGLVPDITRTVTNQLKTVTVGDVRRTGRHLFFAGTWRGVFNLI